VSDELRAWRVQAQRLRQQPLADAPSRGADSGPCFASRTPRRVAPTPPRGAAGFVGCFAVSEILYDANGNVTSRNGLNVYWSSSNYLTGVSTPTESATILALIGILLWLASGCAAFRGDEIPQLGYIAAGFAIRKSSGASN
jgi:hypothetical protein